MPSVAPNLPIARALLAGAEKSKRTARALIVKSAQLREALGPEHPLAKHVHELKLEYDRRVGEHYQPYIEQGEPDPPPPRGISVTCSDVGGPADCPLRGPIVIRSHEWVELPRLPYLQALREAATPAKSEARNPKSQTNPKSE